MMKQLVHKLGMERNRETKVLDFVCVLLVYYLSEGFKANLESFWS